MKTAQDISRLMLAMADKMGEQLTNLKLQKLLYYEQGYHLAYFGTPLFEDEIEAWMYGPVVPSIYAKYEVFQKNSIPGEDGFTLNFESNEEQRLFDEVFGVYNRYSALGLMEMTHNEKPWQSTPIGKGNIISKAIMRDFFKEKLR